MAPGTRDALVDVATQLLDQGGVEAVTLREVGRLAGVSHNAPYKHFASKEALLAAIAARELAMFAAGMKRQPGLRAAMHGYVSWALDHRARFKLVFGSWSIASEELRVAAEAAHAVMIDLVGAAQDAGVLPAGDPERLASLVRALVHGAADLASSGHLVPGGKGNAGPDDLVDDLLGYLAHAGAADRSPAVPEPGLSPRRGG